MNPESPSPITKLQSWLASTQALLGLLIVVVGYGVHVEISLQRIPDIVLNTSRIVILERDLSLIKEQNMASITDRAELHKEGVTYQIDIANLRVDMATLNGKADQILKNQEHGK